MLIRTLKPGTLQIIDKQMYGITESHLAFFVVAYLHEHMY